jgi:hypothetical protein
VLRCIAKQNADPDDLQDHLILLDYLMQCSEFVKRKLKPGQPTGDILAAIIAGKDGYKGSPNHAVMNHLQNLSFMSTEKVVELNPEGNYLWGNIAANATRERSRSSFKVVSSCVGTYHSDYPCQPYYVVDVLLSHSRLVLPFVNFFS